MNADPREKIERSEYVRKGQMFVLREGLDAMDPDSIHSIWTWKFDEPMPAYVERQIWGEALPADCKKPQRQSDLKREPVAIYERGN